MTVKIDKKVPMPVLRSDWPFAEMEVGHSFEVPVEKERSVRACVHQFQTKNEGAVKFTVRRQEDGNLRCWRVA